MEKNRIETAISEYRNNNKAYKLTNSEIHTLLYGEDSCFLVSKSYQSKWDDDYASFRYYSNVTGEYFDDNWTTAAACPHYDNYIKVKSLSEAEKLGLIDIALYNSNYNPTIDHLRNRMTHWFDYLRSCERPMAKVVKGRKVKKGTIGMVIGKVSEPNYCDWKGNDIYAILYTTDGQIVKVNPYYLEREESWNEKMISFVQNLLDEEMKVTDRIQKFDLNGAIKAFYTQEEIVNMINEAKEAFTKYKNDEEIRKYYPSEKLIEWVKNHFPNLNDKEVIEKGIYINKKNGNVNK